MTVKKTRSRVSPVFLFLIFITSFCGSKKYPPGIYAELYTNKGLIVLFLEYDKTPMTTANFIGLAKGNIKNDALPKGEPFYNRSKFHRVVPGHVIQAGIPNVEAFTGPGYTFPNEIHSGLSHASAGMLGMANGGPHTNGSQFYITLGNRSYLDGDYTVFGHVFEGMDVVNSIETGDEIEQIKFVNIGKKAKHFKVNDAVFQKLVETAKDEVSEEEKAREEKEEAYIQNTWPEALSAEEGLRYVIIQEGEVEKPETGAKLQVRYIGRTMEGKKFVSTADNGLPGFGVEAEIFEYELGTDSINPGFDKTISDMQKGEKRIIIVPPALAYGRSGFYGEEIDGELRFVISPNILLIYEVELLNYEGEKK